MQNMMSQSPRMADRRVLLIALVLGAVAAGLAVAFLSSQSRGGSETSAVTVPVLVATEDIPVGVKVTDEMLGVKALPLETVASDVFRDTERTQAVGQTVRYPIARGEQIGRTRLVAAPQVSAISFQIPPGMRGFTIPVNASESPAGLLAPGDFVDVLLRGPVDKVIGPATLDSTVAITTPLGTLVTRDVNGVQRLVAADQLTQVNAGVPVAPVDPQTEVVVTLMQNVQVLSVGNTFVQDVPYDPSVRGEPPGNGTNITLALTPEQAQLMWLARKNGEITLALRRFGENQPVEISPVAGPLRP